MPAPREVRKTVTVVFSDVTGSTALGERLDPESLRRVMGRYFDEMQRGRRSATEGTVEKFIGDAVMAVFGIPVLHEDDALRAVRAAPRCASALAGLNEELERDWGVTIAVRTGVNTGEVVAGDADRRPAVRDRRHGQRRQALRAGRAAGRDPARRARPTSLVRDAVEVEPVEPLELKGKSEPVERVPAAQSRPRPRRAAHGTSTRRWSAGSGSSPLLAAAPTSAPSTSGRATCSPCSAPPGSASRGSSASSSTALGAEATSRCVAAACPTARASPTGRWPRSSAAYGDDSLPGIEARRLRGRSGLDRRAHRRRSGIGGEPEAERRDAWAVRRSSRRRPGSVLSSSSSTTSSGATRPSSTSSSTSPTGLATRPSCSSASPAPSSSTSGRVGAAASSTRPRCCWSG